MKVPRFIGTLLFFSAILACACQRTQAPAIEQELGPVSRLLYGIEMNGRINGYKEMSQVIVKTDQGILSHLTQHTHLRTHLMGKPMLTNIRNESYFDSTYSSLVWSSTTIDQGRIHLKSTVLVREDTAFIQASTGLNKKSVPLPSDVRFENGLYRNDLLGTFQNDTAAVVSQFLFNEPKATVDTWSYRWKGRETFQVAGKVYHCLCLKEINHTSGEHGEIWVDEGSGLVVQEFLQISGIRSFLSDRKIMNHLEFSNLDDILFYPVHELIPDFRKLDYMKVEMVANSAGESLSSGDLNYRGQSFEGMVNDNVIDGIFEIRRIMYDGTDAPGFPYDYPVDSILKPYLEPGFLIESDYPEIRSKAREILGSDTENSWEAVQRLSRWVGTEIRGAIPGGGSALGTLQQREAECGGHSRLLAAFCRSLGIPARLAIGCMYVPDNGGFFGQHAWTEVFMGEAGWIAVDATIKEYDYIDAGHIRLGENASFHPQEIKILEYKTDSTNSIN